MMIKPIYPIGIFMMICIGLWGCPDTDSGPSDMGGVFDGQTVEWDIFQTDIFETSTIDVVGKPDVQAEVDTNSPLDALEDPLCPESVICVDTFPFQHQGDTSISPISSFDAYSCASTTDESGPEVIYQVDVAQPGFLTAVVYDDTGVDVDVQILTDLDPDSCLSRGHHQAFADVPAGRFYVVVDSYANDSTVFDGPYTLEIGFTIPSQGPCTMEEGIMKRVGDGGNHLAMPATGPMVHEAHLVTAEEPPPYPNSPTDELYDHYQLSQERTGFVMYRESVWAPLEGGNFYGAGIGSTSLFPVEHEAWYVNMYWTSASRPDRGTRMILRLPDSNRAVVVAAGYETGPGNLNNIGGTCEETHFYLGTQHKSILTLGIATEETLPFGPRVCMP